MIELQAPPGSRVQKIADQLYEIALRVSPLSLAAAEDYRVKLREHCLRRARERCAERVQ